MYVSKDGSKKINIGELNFDNPNCEWDVEMHTEDVIRLSCDLLITPFHISTQLHSIIDEIHSEFDLQLSGVEYDINEHEILFVFSKIENVVTNELIEEVASTPERYSIVIQKTLAYNNKVSITGAFKSLSHHEYDINSISVEKNNGIFLKADRE